MFLNINAPFFHLNRSKRHVNQKNVFSSLPIEICLIFFLKNINSTYRFRQRYNTYYFIWWRLSTPVVIYSVYYKISIILSEQNFTATSAVAPLFFAIFLSGLWNSVYLVLFLWQLHGQCHSKSTQILHCKNIFDTLYLLLGSK